MSAEDLNLEVRETFYDSVVEMFELDLSVLPNVTGTTNFYFTNFVIPKANIFPSEDYTFQTGEKVKWRRSETSSADQEYEPVPIIATGFDRTTKGQIPQPELQISNVFGLLSELIESLDDLIGVKVIRRRTLAKYLGNFPTKDYDTYFPSDIYYIERKVSETSMSITFQLASPFDLEGLQLPRRVVTHNHCLWEYRGDECGYGNGRSSDLNGLPLATAFDDVPTSGDLYDSFGVKQQEYLDALSTWIAAKKDRDDKLAAKNLAEGKKNNACDAVTSDTTTRYQFDSEETDEEDKLDGNDSTFALVRVDGGSTETVAIVWSGSTVTSDSRYRASSRVGNTAGGVPANNAVGVRTYTYNGTYDVAGSFVTFSFLPQGVKQGSGAFRFSNSVFGTENAFEWEDEETFETSILPFGLREVDFVVTEGQENCDIQTGNFDAANSSYVAAETALTAAKSDLDTKWTAMNLSEQYELRERFDVCGKRLTSCQLRFGQSNLPYGGFPGSNLAREA